MTSPPPIDAFDLAPEEVRRRFHWAIGQGNPTWLWPDTAVTEWQAALRGIERVTREILTASHAPARLEGTAEAIGIACYTSGMGPLLGYWLKQGHLTADPPIHAVLDLHLQHNRLRMEKMVARAREIVGALSESGIEPTILKGMHTAFSYFPEPATRPLSDIDVLVNRSDRAKAAEVLSELGFELRDVSSSQENWRPRGARAEPRTLRYVHADDPWSVDLQFTLDLRYCSGERLITLDDLHPASAPGHWGLSPQAKVLGQPLSLLFLAAHASCPLNSLTLLRQTELVFVIRRDTETDALDWDRLVSATGRTGALAGIYPALVICNRLVPGIVPASVVAACTQAAPAGARRIIDALSPADAQRVVRCSISERFMWSPSLSGRLKLIFRSLLPPNMPLAALARIYRMRAWRLARLAVTR